MSIENATDNFKPIKKETKMKNAIGIYSKSHTGMYSEKAREILEAMFVQFDLKKAEQFGIRPIECGTFDYNNMRGYWKIIQFDNRPIIPYMMLSKISTEIKCVLRDYAGEVVLSSVDSCRAYNTADQYDGHDLESHNLKITKMRIRKFSSDIGFFLEKNSDGVGALEAKNTPIHVYTRYGKCTFTLNELRCLEDIICNGFKSSKKIEQFYGKDFVDNIIGRPSDMIKSEGYKRIYCNISDKTRKAIDMIWRFNVRPKSEDEMKVALREPIAQIYKEEFGDREDLDDLIAEEIDFLGVFCFYNAY
jgi:hypothetical protein